MSVALSAIRRMEAAGFKMEADGGKLRVYPAEQLSPEQRTWVAANKAAILAALELVAAEPAIAELAALFDATVLSVSPADGATSSLVSVRTPEPEHEPFTAYPVRQRQADGRHCCNDCRHSQRIPESDRHSFRLCGAGYGGGFAMQYQHCEGWQAVT